MPSIFEDIADLYLRLNGFFTVKNFFQHPMYNPPVAETDIDILALRLPYEREVTGREPSELPIDPKIVWSRSAVLVAIAEVKGKPDPFNQRWFRDPEVLPYTLRRVGFTNDDATIKKVSEELRNQGAGQSEWSDKKFEFRLVLFSDYDGGVPRSALKVKWEDVLAFLRRRFGLLAKSPIKRGMGPLRDSIFGFLYNQYLSDNLSSEMLRQFRPVTQFRAVTSQYDPADKSADRPDRQLP